MLIEIGRPAEAVDGPCGRVGAVLLSRTTGVLTHLVIDHRGHGSPARLVPAAAIAASHDHDDEHPHDHPDRWGCRLGWTRRQVREATEADALTFVEVGHAGGASGLYPSYALPSPFGLARDVGEGRDDHLHLAETSEGDARAVDVPLVTTSVHRNPPGTVRIDESTQVVDVDERVLATVTGLRFGPDLGLRGVVGRVTREHGLHHDLVEYPSGPDQHPEVTERWIRYDLPADHVVTVPLVR